MELWMAGQKNPIRQAQRTENRGRHSGVQNCREVFKREIRKEKRGCELSLMDMITEDPKVDFK